MSPEDPLSQLGYGIVAYVNMLYTLCWVFIGFSVLLIPTMMAFNQGDAYDGDHFVGKANTMIGNLGYSSVECRNIPVSLGNLVMSCPYGRVGTVFDYGINNPDSGSPVDACTRNEFNKSCNPSKKTIGDKFKEAIGSESYQVKFNQDHIYVGTEKASCLDKTNLLFVQYSCI